MQGDSRAGRGLGSTLRRSAIAIGIASSLTLRFRAIPLAAAVEAAQVRPFAT